MDIAVVTGAGRGIGAAITRKLASERLLVVMIVNQSMGLAGELAADIRSAGGRVEIVQCDVSRSSEVDRAVDTITAAWGIPSILVNNAGVGGPYHPVHEVSEEEWDWIMNTNVKSMFMLSKRLLPKMREAGFGRIINMSSIFGHLGGAQSAAYATSKHAILGLTKSIAAEWGPYGITCNAICPGFVSTDMGVQEAQVDNHLLRILDKSPVKRVAAASEVADLVYYLTGASGSFINGSSFIIDGGITAHTGI
jgi:3-oxoacyl-[acyl-carrier protein] reductase